MITHIILDVDGTLTDSSVIYSDNGAETKVFSTRDGIGFAVAKKCDIKIIVVTGRESAVTRRRMAELGAEDLVMGVTNKSDFIKDYLGTKHIDPHNVLYVGDDINDYFAMQLVGNVACPCDACEEVKSIADYASSVPGGKGAFRDIMEHIVGKDRWIEATNELFGAAGI